MAKLNFSLVKTHTQQREQPDSPEARQATRVAVATVLLRPTPWLVPPPSPPLMAAGENQEAREAAPRAADDYGADGRDPTPLLSARACVGNKFNR